jgi:protocatechuate 3,4-dioxygenase beta subunit
MKQSSLSLASLLLASTLAAQTPGRNSAGDKPKKKEDCSIAGMVVKLAGSEPLKRATIQLESTDDRTHSISTVTDAGGRFQLKGIAAGRYRLKVLRHGFVTQEYGQKTPNDPGSALTLSPGQDVKDLLFRLIPSAVIAGRIIDEDGEPLPWAQVIALREVYAEGKRKLAPETMVATNDLGEYRLFGLRPSRYFISASYKPNEHLTGSGGMIQASDDASSEQGYVPSYYPGSPDPAKAVALTIKAGEEIPSVEILLRPVTVFSVRGRVVNMVSRRSSPGVMVQLVPQSTGLAWNLPLHPTNLEKPDGMFEIRDVLPGSYTLIAYWFDEGKRYQARQTFEVGNSDVDGVTLLIAPGVPVYGHVIWEGQPSLERGELSVSLSGADTEYAWGGSARVMTGDMFTLRDVSEGAYRLSVSGQSRDCFVKSVRYGTTEALDDGFIVRRGTDATLEVALSSRGAHIQGTVADADHLPAAGVWVVLVPDEARRSQSRLYEARTTDQYGHFDLRGITPGNYKLFSWEEVEQGAWEDPEFLKSFEDKGEKIVVQEGDSKSIDLVTIKTPSTEQQNP